MHDEVKHTGVAAAPQAWTIGSVLSWTAERFEREGIESARLDAELLLAETLGVERLRLYLDYAKPLQAPELASYRALIKRRLAREPVAYITGRREFWSLELAVTRDVLVPRPESELLVELAVDHLEASGPRARPSRVLDVGTGSGAIAIAVAHQLRRRDEATGKAAEGDEATERAAESADAEESQRGDARRPAVQVTAIDDQPAALEVARANAARHGVELCLHAGDLLDALPPHSADFDVIVSNPPYIASAELDELMPEVSLHEPRHALDGGADGLDVIRRLAAQAAPKLAPGGLLMIEIGWQQGEAVAALLEQHGLTADVRKDLAGLDRVVRGRR